VGAAAPARVPADPEPEEASAYQYSPQERVVVEMNRQRHFIGTPPKVASLIRQIVEATEPTRSW
jgi:alkanesulfonate monooxygenase SsuD/methylene tetrahydromethanopterin reductase-like flavin-dependent oxidoreductase (luciferase family)